MNHENEAVDAFGLGQGGLPCKSLVASAWAPRYRRWTITGPKPLLDPKVRDSSC